jgi:hypothetical protein
VLSNLVNCFHLLISITIFLNLLDWVRQIASRGGASFTVPDVWAPGQSANSFEEQCVTVQNSDATPPVITSLSLTQNA